MMPPGKGSSKSGGGLAALMALGAPPKKNPAVSSPSESDADSVDPNAFDEKENAAPDDMLVGAAHDVMSSLRARDSEGFAVALKDFVGMC